MTIHVMIDIETLGPGPHAPVLEIGIYPFTLDGSPFAPHSPMFHGGSGTITLGLQEQVALGHNVDAGTLEWWMSDACRRDHLTDLLSTHRESTLVEGVSQFAATIGYLRHYNERQELDINVWAHGPSFDLIILRELMKKVGVKCPWSYRQERDLRTWVAAGGYSHASEVPVEFEGTPHKAVDDARHQARVVQYIARKLAP